MKRRIFWSILLTSLLALTVTVTVVLITVSNIFAGERRAEIRAETVIAAEGYSDGGSAYITRVGEGSHNRITLVGADGTVLYDSAADALSLGSHADRPEILEAVQNGSGEATRASETLGEETYYYAVRLADGCVLRVAATMKSIFTVIDETATYVALAALFMLAVSVLVGELMTRRIIRPINMIDPEKPLSSDTYDELTPLIVSMDRQNKKIGRQMEKLSEKQNEFARVTDGMNEGLIIFSSERQILTANRSAKRVFSRMQAEGLSYTAFCRDIPYIRACEQAFLGKSAEERLEKDGRIYRITADPAGDGDEEFAAVMFICDITEDERAGQMRREFSANVSHELKTPLTSIIGCAEIIKNGVAKKEDINHFAGQIYDEGKRLLSLIEDIIKLSKLDEEGLRREFTTVDLYETAEKTAAELADKAEKHGVSLTVSGEHTTVDGIPSTLHEMIYNLCDNAVIYNRSGGKVTVTVGSDDGHAFVSVSDTGIGIAPEDRQRVFERFYRADKSRSKANGGTGLGLSIVKHGAAVHGAQIELSSTVGVGSDIRIVF